MTARLGKLAAWSLCVATLITLAAPEAQARKIRVVSWNLEWFPGWKSDAQPEKQDMHMKMVQKALRRIDPDVLILSEVRDAAAVNEAIRGLRGFKLNTITTFGGRPQQIAIASRYNASRSGMLPIPRVFMGPPRGFIFAELELPGHKCLQVFGAHWKSNHGSPSVNFTYRELSALQMYNYAEWLASGNPDCRGLAQLITGDLNTGLDEVKFEDDDSIRYLMGQGFYWPFLPLKPEQRITWLGNQYHEPTQFDHFLIRNAGQPRARVLDGGGSSDHAPIEMILNTRRIGEGG